MNLKEELKKRLKEEKERRKEEKKLSDEKKEERENEKWKEKQWLEIEKRIEKLIKKHMKNSNWVIIPYECASVMGGKTHPVELKIETLTRSYLITEKDIEKYCKNHKYKYRRCYIDIYRGYKIRILSPISYFFFS